jgi:hypothetical protein
MTSQVDDFKLNLLMRWHRPMSGQVKRSGAPHFSMASYVQYTLLKKAERDPGQKHEGDGKFHHPRRTIGKIRLHQRLGLSIYMGDGIFRHPCVVVPRHAWLF